MSARGRLLLTGWLADLLAAASGRREQRSSLSVCHRVGAHKAAGRAAGQSKGAARSAANRLCALAWPQVKARAGWPASLRALCGALAINRREREIGIKARNLSAGRGARARSAIQFAAGSKRTGKQASKQASAGRFATAACRCLTMASCESRAHEQAAFARCSRIVLIDH